METLLHKSRYFFLLLLFFAFPLIVNAQCTIATTTNASALTCGISPTLIACNGILNIGNGTSATVLNMNNALNLTCLGPIHLIVKNNASIDFSSGNNRLTLAAGSSISFEGNGTLIGGSCNASERIYIGTDLIASCNGGAGADFNFAQLVAQGGYNPVSVTPSSASSCVAPVSFTFTATASPSTGATFNWYDSLTSGVLLFTGNSFTTPAISVTTTYYVDATYGVTYTTTPRKAVVVSIDATTTWNGTSWSNGSPTNKNIIFAGNFNSTSNLVGCSCQVNSGNVVFNPNHSLTLTNGLTVSGGSLTFENNASLVQINAVTNSGNITYKRQTSIIRKLDYTYWSSPVFPQTLINVSPNTALDKFYSFNAATDSWVLESSTNTMIKGKGYIIRGPQFFPAPNPPSGIHQASFIGVPNNGPVTIPVTTGTVESSHLIGSPYPSALDANSFINANSGVIDGTLYFWTHNTAITNNLYTSDDYATYNLTGGVATVSTIGTVADSGGVVPTGKIGSGQGFFVTSVASGDIVFNNSMRVGVGGITGTNDQFFKIKGDNKIAETDEKHRVWLNLTNTQGAFKQTLIGYLTGATNEYDNLYDGESFDGNEFIDFYSIQNDINLVIQGRQLPFDETDEISLGYKTEIEGFFSIGVEKVDGDLLQQNVILEDKKTSKFQNLTAAPYSFSTEKGEFKDRFVLSYKNNSLPASANLSSDKSVVVSIKNKQIVLHSPGETMKKVFVYDLLGKEVYRNEKIEGSNLIINNLKSNNQTLIVKVILKNGQLSTTKIIY
ncbi:T9SS sorting signal type C domain-containing protein [Flavobacterium sp. K5-23]|uniref:T9SS sorting signal type C domain-containing protein n=1 Tax=Flavobacterium sp. K5-23 TaxID=2746225 RepID=UPI00200F2333|nr:T9SS sorting signal type C domain-containing protein [Flavobacterium sp. K5-23]UQD55725.1 T9SS sorting signal type C domain-containing protein [Flavobacterium sp. K5-23]